MSSTVLKGSPREVAEKIAQLGYDTVEAIVFTASANGRPGKLKPDEDIFAEMAGLMANAPDADDSREAIYTRMPGE